MTVLLIIISVFCGIERVSMISERACVIAADQINDYSKHKVARAYCIMDARPITGR